MLYSLITKMIQNSIELLSEPFKTKIKVFLSIVRSKYKNVEPFETLRTYERQIQLVKEKKSWTLNSYHLKWKAVDFVFIVNGKQTWVGDYAYLHYVWEMCWIKPIKNSQWKIVEMCHLQDNLRSIKYVMSMNSEKRHKSNSDVEKSILNYVNNEFRKHLS